MVVAKGNVKFISVGQPTATDKLVDYVPEAVEKIQGIFSSKGEKRNERKYEGSNGAVYVSDEIDGI